MLERKIIQKNQLAIFDIGRDVVAPVYIKDWQSSGFARKSIKSHNVF